MEMLDAIVWVLYWFGFYGIVMAFGWALDKLLRRLIGKGIFPEGYFK